MDSKSNISFVKILEEAKSEVIQYLLYTSISDEEVEGAEKIFNQLMEKYSD